MKIKQLVDRIYIHCDIKTFKGKTEQWRFFELGELTNHHAANGLVPSAVASTRYNFTSFFHAKSQYLAVLEGYKRLSNYIIMTVIIVLLGL